MATPHSRKTHTRTRKDVSLWTMKHFAVCTLKGTRLACIQFKAHLELSDQPYKRNIFQCKHARQYYEIAPSAIMSSKLRSGSIVGVQFLSLSLSSRDFLHRTRWFVESRLVYEEVTHGSLKFLYHTGVSHTRTNRSRWFENYPIDNYS